MSKLYFLPLLLAATSVSAANLTEQETVWLRAAAPVLSYAQQLKLPFDIIVQPQAGENDVPLAMGFDKDRCKLVLSLRGNPNAEKVLDGVPQDARGELIEAMAAMRFNPAAKALAERLSAAGKRGKVVIVAVMRKLVHWMLGVLKSGTRFNPQLALART